jgi:hypothetical protein
MMCVAGNHEIAPFKAAHWTCSKCHVEVVACFVCYPCGNAYEYVDDARRAHVCAGPELELVP